MLARCSWLACAAVVLSSLCLYSGSSPDAKTSYAILTLNTSHIGRDFMASVDERIMSSHVRRTIQKPQMTAPALLRALPFIGSTHNQRSRLGGNHLPARSLFGDAGSAIESMVSSQTEAGLNAVSCLSTSRDLTAQQQRLSKQV